MLRKLLAVPRVFVGALLLIAIGVMLAGVVLRYIMVPVADAFGFPPINFFWVEETGETLLAWLTMIGAAVGILERTHFTVRLFVHRLPPRTQHCVHVFIHLAIVAFGGILAWQAWKLVLLNAALASPALEISLGWMYGSGVAGGVLIMLYAAVALFVPATMSHHVVE